MLVVGTQRPPDAERTWSSGWPGLGPMRTSGQHIKSTAMSGHSKWSQIKRQKGANDAKRGAIFTKIGARDLIAAREGGGDPDANYRLRLAMDKARAANMPADNIKRAIEKASGGGAAEQYEEIVYEGYGPGGVAILVETATDNKNRTAADVRSLFAKAGGSLAGAGAVAWQFEPRGVVAVARDGQDPDEVGAGSRSTRAPTTSTPNRTRSEIVTEPGAAGDGAQGARSGGIKVEVGRGDHAAQDDRRGRWPHVRAEPAPDRDARGPRRRPARDARTSTSRPRCWRRPPPRERACGVASLPEQRALA